MLKNEEDDHKCKIIFLLNRLMNNVNKQDIIIKVLKGNLQTNEKL